MPDTIGERLEQTWKRYEIPILIVGYVALAKHRYNQAVANGQIIPPAPHWGVVGPSQEILFQEETGHFVPGRVLTRRRYERTGWLPVQPRRWWQPPNYLSYTTLDRFFFYSVLVFGYGFFAVIAIWIAVAYLK